MNRRTSSILRFLLGTKSVGFLMLHTTNKGSYVGSFLITDLKGIPIEFRCTHALKPNAIQSSLYGEALLSYIGVEICGKPLISSAKNKPNIIFINKEFLLNIEEYAPCPLLLIRAVDEPDPAMENLGTEYQIEVIKPKNDGLKPLEIKQKAEMKQETRVLVERLYSDFDILGSFERMEQAVKSLTGLSSRFQ